jgi:DNA-directed RNA polymerase specialized sigma24 family protein
VKKDWVPTQDAFRNFLQWLDEGVDSGGERYLDMRRRLALYFDRKNCLCPDDLADETLNRVARKLEEKGSITDLSPAHYCYVAARFVFLEYLRGGQPAQTAFEEPLHSAVLPGLSGSPGKDSENQAREKLHQCLERCLDQLPEKDRELILEYYRGEQRTKIEGRYRLAKRLGLSMNALSIRACRIRDKLEVCIRGCCREA